jgi:GMP synthase-like glutamine amidotransferase
MASRIGYLECDHVDDRFRGIDGDYSDMFDALLGEPGSIELVPYDVVNGVLPASPDECDGWLAGGSRFSVYDDVEWIHRLSGFVRDIRDAEAPYVGICFGHQLLAHSIGGRTEKADVGWGAGAIDTWLNPTQSDALLLYMHQDQVVALPDGAKVLGHSAHCPIAMLRVGSMLGVQAHPEFSVEYVGALLDARVDRIGPDATARAKASLERVADAEHAGDAGLLGQWIATFLRDNA